MRKPIQMELRGLKTPRERVWEALLLLDALPSRAAGFDKETIQDHCLPMVGLSLVDDYCDDLEQAGWLRRSGVGVGKKAALNKPLLYRLARRQADAPRVNMKGAKVVQGQGNEAMWRAMKVLPSFNYLDIARAATLGTLVVAPQTAKAYVVHLARAGYLLCLKPAKPGTPAQHRLINNTGPHAPCITRAKVVFDRNTGTFAPLETAQEVCDALA